jgi:hypothetical protein
MAVAAFATPSAPAGLICWITFFASRYRGIENAAPGAGAPASLLMIAFTVARSAWIATRVFA